MSSTNLPASSQAMLDNLERMKKRNQERLAEIVRSFSETSNSESNASATNTASFNQMISGGSGRSGGSGGSGGKASIQTTTTSATENTDFLEDDDDDENDLQDNASQSSSSSSSSLMNPYFGNPAAGVPAWFSSYMAQQEARQQLVKNKLHAQKEEIDRLNNNHNENDTGESSVVVQTLCPLPQVTPTISPFSKMGEEEKKEQGDSLDDNSILVDDAQDPRNESPLKLQPMVVTEEAEDDEINQSYLTSPPSTKDVVATLSGLSSEMSHSYDSEERRKRRHQNIRNVFRADTTKSPFVRNADEINTLIKLSDAKQFLEQFAAIKGEKRVDIDNGGEQQQEDPDEQVQLQKSQSQQQSQEDRLEQVQRDIERTGTYEHTPQELEFGCQLAWKNAARCNARQYMDKLVIRDSRYVSSAKDCFEDLVKHIKTSFNDGAIRPVMTLYRPKQDGQSAPVRVWNRQLLGYAAYELVDGKIMGDPINLQFTALCQEFGWTPPKIKTDFDILPLLISDASTGHAKPQVFEIPSEEIPEVRITHPEFDLFELLGLRCYSMPCVSNMGVEIGGVHYQTACFSRWYQVTEIGRQFLDTDRYNLAESVAVACNIPRPFDNGLWKDTAQMELHKAILYSFEEQLIPCVDHYKASQSFVHYYDLEMKEHGKCPADKASLMPPAGGSMTAVYHKKDMANHVEKPQFRRQLSIWDDLRIGLPEPIVVESIRGLSRAYPTNAETNMYDEVFIYHASEFGKALRMATMISCEFGENATGPIALDDLPDLLIQHSDYSGTNRKQSKTLVVIVASTNGMGDAPESAKSFVDQMKMVQEHSVRDVEFSILALGNFAYRQSSAAFGHKVYSLLEKAGCSPALNIQIADELNDPQAALDSFTKLITQVCTGQGQLGIDLGAISSRPPAFASISLEARTKMLETSSTSENNHRDPGVLHYSSSWANRAHKLKPSMDMFTFNVNEGYESLLNEAVPGDLVALYPSNLNDVVELVFRNVNHSKRSVAREYLKSNIDLSRPLKSADIQELRKLMRNTDAREIVATIASQSSQENNPSIEQLVQMLPPGSIPMEWVVQFGPPIDPRFFSIAEVNLLENSVSFAQSVYTFESNKKAGLASRWLRSLRKGEMTSALFVTSSFHAPANRDCPLLLFAADSGIASFHSLWQPNCRNPLYLFYACKNPSEIAFRSNISDLKEEGRLKPYIAYSHVKNGRMEINELILRARDVLLKRIHIKKGIIYISGPPGFERTVRNALVTVLAEGNEYFPGMGTMRALEYLAVMSQTKRLFLQVYGKPAFTEDPTLVMWQEAVAKTVRAITNLEQIGLLQGRTDDTFALDSDFMGSSKIQSGKRYNPKVVFTDC
ncbi:unnamed protein product [Cylindrotheca closterium]|uniref:nitric-oxide synthase (NADPH) n=1 Tax=Cylindrotheca closterium TaxID=2856 RepID=A0AAD2G1P0_9STRA|nr:unnamed protein product [Cylindrotheca closterium]